MNEGPKIDAASADADEAKFIEYLHNYVNFCLRPEISLKKRRRKVESLLIMVIRPLSIASEYVKGTYRPGRLRNDAISLLVCISLGGFI